MSKTNFNLRIDEELNDKLAEIAKSEERSKNAQIEYILKTYIEKYEQVHNKINITSRDNSTQNINIKNK